MLKLIASDIDGTLLREGQTELSPRLYGQIRKLREMGIPFCAASGRPYGSLRLVFSQVADEIYFLCENGAVVMSPEGKLLSRSEIDRQISLQLIREILAQPDCEVMISGTNMTYLIPKQQDYVDHVRSFVGERVTILGNPEEVPEPCVKITAYCRSGSAALEPRMKPRWENIFNVAIAGQPWLDFTLADKGTGITALCRCLGIEAKDVMAFGDNFNDAPMLEAVGHPYLMSTAAEPLRKRFPTQCDCVEDILEECIMLSAKLLCPSDELNRGEATP